MSSLTEGSEHKRLSSGATVGRYRVLRELGAGGMGTVYDAVHVDLGKRVALKILHPWLAELPQIHYRFILEGQASARIRHPHVVDVHDVGQDVGRTYLVMERLEGQGLQEVLESRGRLSLPEIASILVPIASALDAAHQQGIVHRDVKPSNIFLSQGDFGETIPKLLDFGISKVGAEESDPCCFLGTPSYMSPEQAFGSPAIGYQSDQYSLGVIAYQCAIGRLPFESNSLYWTLHKVVESEFQDYEDLKVVDPAFEKLVRQSMARSPQARFASMKDFARALLHWGDEQLISSWSPVLDVEMVPEVKLQRRLMLQPPIWTAEAEGRMNQDLSHWSVVESAPHEASHEPEHIDYSNPQALLSVVALTMGVILALFTVNGPSSPSVAAVVSPDPANPKELSFGDPLMVEIRVDPADARLELDGRMVGEGKIKVEVPVDGRTHQLRISSPTYESVVFVFREVPPPTHVVLRPKNGRLVNR